MIKIKDIIILEEAIADLKDGKEFYNKKNPGVGEYFWDNIIADFESLYIYAGIHNKKFGFYRMFSKRFPYAIYYDIHDDLAIIAAVLPMRRNPDFNIEKLKGRGQTKIKL